MKKFISFTAAAVLTLGLMSCGSTPKAEAKPAETKAAEPAVLDLGEPDFLCTNAEVTELPDSDPFILDDMEDGNYWKGVGDTWDQWGSHNLSLAAGVVKDWAASGTHSLKCIMEAAGPETSKQATWCCYDLIDNNLSGFKWVEVSIYNPNDFDFEMNIAMQDGVKWAWMQTATLMIKPGVHTCLFDISEMPDEFLENIYCFMIQSLNENPGGKVYVDNFRLYN